MAVEGIAAASAVSQTADSGQSTEQDRISELVRLEQDVQKLKTDYKDKANKNGMSQTEVTSKIRKYEKLIAKIEQEIRRIKRQESSRPAGLKKKDGKDGAKRSDSTVLSMAALKASYRMLIPVSGLTAVQEVSEESKADLSTQAGGTLDELV
ncbi:hypothetical protein CAFE_16440 [Caprobacter fermentans]|uniref:Uncharacterized protein n=1 Tax=Caproicibacter fermentans TaxID=2576756 RepID=A0A6N8I054_9FIRM|nr:hypothetical protein [Caproicibacter fermentans]MVB10943.1 hypothetical protein [Caproicibacter fermentans]OCN01646.1 hypothetical protein A7X67_00690 [Clostridium sp. W14A]QNK39439.1 hypothetical protein HCR03_11840 [Caproicibacter fermentans]